MILVDTPVWIDHFRSVDPALQELIAGGRAGIHPFVLGELALGGAAANTTVWNDLQPLDQPTVASPAEALAFIAWAKLAGAGIGYVDAHQLLSVRMTHHGSLLTRDRHLHAQAERFAIAITL